MSDGRQVNRSQPSQPHTDEQETHQPTADVDVSDVDDLLDEIDSVLEDNAEEFVKNYVQKGGQ